MSNLLISFLLAIGASGWIFNKLQSRSGYNTGQSIKAAAICALVIFVIVLIILSLVF